MRRFFCSAIMLIALVLTSCSGAHTSTATGSLSFNVVWQNSGLHAPTVYHAAPVGVATIRIIISASDMSTVQQDFSAVAGTGTVSGVPVGLGRAVTVQGLAGTNTVLYAGSVGNVTVSAGQNTNCGTVTMTAVGSGTIPSPPTNVTAIAGNAQVTLSWTASSGATSYNIYWSTTTGVNKSSTNISNATSPYTHSPLTNGTTIYYVVTAVNGSSESAESSQVSATPQASGGSIPTNGLVAYYPFNGNANDTSGNGNNGTVNGATLTADRFGTANSAYSFDGVNNYIRISDSSSLDINNSITITTWCNLTQNSRGALVRKINTWGAPYGGYTLYATSSYISTELQLSSGGVTIVKKDMPLTLNTWYFVAITYDGAFVRLYLNGAEVFSNAASGTINTNNNDVFIGSSEGVEYFPGKIDDVRIFSRALSASEVLALYNQ